MFIVISKSLVYIQDFLSGHIGGPLWGVGLGPHHPVPGGSSWAGASRHCLTYEPRWQANQQALDGCLLPVFPYCKQYRMQASLYPFLHFYTCLSRVGSKKQNCWITKSYANTSGAWHTLVLRPAMPLHMTNSCSSSPITCHPLVKGGLFRLCFPKYFLPTLYH